MKVIYTLFGGLTGGNIEGYADSGGMKQLAGELRAPDTMIEEPIGWAYFSRLMIPIEKASAYKIVLMGFSGGGSRGTWLCNAVGSSKIDLFVAVDPSPSWQMEPIGPNVKKCLCFHNTAPFMFGLGGGQVTGRTQIETVQIAEQHLFVDWNTAVHGKIIEEVRAL